MEVKIMSLVRFRPLYDDFQHLQDRFNQIFGDTGLSRLSNEETMGNWAPLCDIYEDGENIVVKAEMPGIDKKNLDIQVDKNVLVLRDSALPIPPQERPNSRVPLRTPRRRSHSPAR